MLNIICDIIEYQIIGNLGEMMIFFDIDKTLLIGSHCHFYSFKKAFKDIYGVDVTLNIHNIQGMTDKQIIYYFAKENNIHIHDFDDIREKIVYHYKKNLKISSANKANSAPHPASIAFLLADDRPVL